ncbi:hypothetical protein BJV82DRAFT_173548 [Fennellomyces sp. T-0311]|nr:hypothetical protein BJV82DRAFT_173548 [Fennellomyces sp. T-0311]
MLPQKPQAGFKFVIKSKLTTEQTTSSSEKPTESTTKQPEPASDDIERKRKRNDKDIVPLASKKVFFYNQSLEKKHNLTKRKKTAKKKIHSQLERWNQKKAELKEASSEEVYDYADMTIMACLLCQRKFKTLQDLQRHQQVSELHKKNLQDPVCVGKAQMKIRYVKTEAEQAEERATEQSYRNRAAERRQAYGQPEKPALPTFQRPNPRPVRPVDKTSSASVETPINDDNVGARMLQQMGWRRGEGLGKDASGIVDPIAAEQYAQGVGLGAAHAKKSGPANGADTYKDRVKEMARRRYEEDN